MGGKALNKYNVFTRRINHLEYDALISHITDILRHDGIMYYVPIVLQDKEDFGDIDILLYNVDDVYQYIKTRFKPTAVHANDKTYSFDFDDVQIDFIVLNKYNWEMSKVYFSNDPVGNLMGNLARMVGLYYGTFGLYYIHYSNILNKKFIMYISKNPRDIFNFYGLNFDEFLKGFDDVYDAYMYIVGSRLFVKSAYKLENLSHNDRNRKRKRDNYNVFLDYIYERNFPDNILDLERFDLHKEVYNSFGVKIEDFLYEIEKKEKEHILFKSKFNGNFIMKHFPIVDKKELSDIMFSFKMIFGGDDTFKKFILNSSEDEIINKLKEVI